MALTIRTLSPEAENMLEAYMEAKEIKSKSKAIDEMIANYRFIESLKKQRELLREDKKRLQYRYNDMVKSLSVLKSHFDNLKG